MLTFLVGFLGLTQGGDGGGHWRLKAEMVY